MTVYAAFLRGINVGGHKPIKMAPLRELCASLGLGGVRTVLQSGNIVFATETRKVDALATRIQDAIEGEWGFRSTVILRSAEQIEDAIARNPFAGRDDVDPRRLLVMFLAGEPGPDAADALAAAIPAREEALLDGWEAYLHYPDGIGRSKLTGARIERALGVAGTARNWNTLARVRDAAGALGG